MQEPLVTVCIPTYEPKPGHLQEAIACVLAQSESRWQLVIRDDASQTDVRAIVEPYLTDSRITFHRSQQRSGIGGNWNGCLQFARTPFVQFLFQDDCWTPNYLQKALAVMESQPSAGIVSMGHHYSFEGEVTPAQIFADVQKARREVGAGLHEGIGFLHWWIDHELTPNIIGEPSFVMIRRSTLEKAGPFAEDLPQFLDAEMWIRCLLVADWYAVREEHGFFRVHPDGATMRNAETGAGIYDRLQTFERFIVRLPPGELRTATIAARSKALQTMARKFFLRITNGQHVGTGGSALKNFAMKHPFLMGKSIVQALMTRGE